MSIDPQRFRTVLGAFCSGITVVTALDADGAPLGLTCQSFSSLSLDPPLVLLAPARSSSTWPRIRAAGGFGVAVLAAGQEDVALAMARSGTDKFAGLDWAPSAHGRPRPAGIAAWLDCDLHAEHDGGDHTVVVGAVRDLDVTDHPPLLYHRGAFATLHRSEDRGDTP
ncbi:flavin reductase family protein [Pseudonocardia sp. ICBG162]|uniref:flavin reductase family protein n=1 Tax=Pseudonocardia sp. ICBG162 TaxID=2846761 RepID=UPI001CF690F8|nr:flavin reductase family protein [Pseudonocardia sp. ICBG162]